MVLDVLAQPADGPWLWAGYHSRARIGGAIDRFVQNWLHARPEAVALWLGQSDGFHRLEDLVAALELLGGHGPRVIAALCHRLPEGSAPLELSKVVLLPLDDDAFVHGVVPMLNLPRLEWGAKAPTLFWRGGCSGERARIICRLGAVPCTDVGFVVGAPDATLARGWADVTDFQRHKWVLIVDGTVISSAHQWCFAIGSVPVLITHPSNRHWFTEYLQPYVNFVPLAYDLSDVDEVMDWLQHHDAECERIAEAAYLLAEQLFSAESQQAFVERELRRVVAGP